MGKRLLVAVFLLFIGVVVIQNIVKPKELPAHTGPFVCVTGVALPREQAHAASTQQIRQGIEAIKRELGITIIWQLFESHSTEEDWLSYFRIAKEEGVEVVAALFDANYDIGCDGQCDLGPNQKFLESVKRHPNEYNGVLHGVLLVDEPVEDGLDGADLRQLYTQAKAIANVPMIVGFSRQLWKYPRFGFTDGICDICLISALEVRGGVLDEETLRANQSTSRQIIRQADPNAKIYTSVPVFGQPESKADYSMPSPEQLKQIVDLLLDSDLGRVDGLMWQSWLGPTQAKSEKQQTLSLPQFVAQREIVNNTCP